MHLYPDAYFLKDGLMMVLPFLTSAVPSSLLGIATYVLSSLALYTLATRRGIQKAWLSWVPVLNVWIIGSLSDQYRYVVKGEFRAKRKSLLVLNLLVMLIVISMVAVAIGMVVDLVTSMMYGVNIEAMVRGPVLMEVLLAVPLAGLAVAAAVVRFIALYDVYKSMDPDNAVLFLVLSILFGVTEPFLLFFNRQKDNGMPPRKPAPERIPREEPWQDQEQKDYL
ncbi:MAG: hypothetical protein ACI3V0_04660 [Faecousia sp.]